MPTTPCWTISVVVIGVVAVAIATVLVVVGQGEQEATACTVVVVVSTGPRQAGIATNQFSSAQLEDRDRGSFVVASTVEGRRTGPVFAAFVAEDPVLVGGTNPGIDLSHLRTGQQCTFVELAGRCGLGGTVVTTVGTGVVFGSTTIGESGVTTLDTVVATTVVLTCFTIGSTITVTRTMTAVGTSDMLDPGMTDTLVAIITITAIGTRLTNVTTHRVDTGAGVTFATAFGSTITNLAPGTILEALLATSVNDRCGTTFLTIPVSEAVVRALTVTFTTTATSTFEGLRRAVAVGAVAATVDAGTTATVVASR